MRYADFDISYPQWIEVGGEKMEHIADEGKW